MSNAINFLTASGEELQTWFMSGDSGPTVGQAVVNLRDQTAAAAEAKVRGECANEQESAKVLVLSWKSIAERAEAERDTANANHEATLDQVRLTQLRHEAALADAKREGEAEGVRKALKAYDQARTYLAGWQALQDLANEFAPTPARSVELVVHIRGTNGVDGITITPEQARAIVALAREDGNA